MLHLNHHCFPLLSTYAVNIIGILEFEAALFLLHKAVLSCSRRILVWLGIRNFVQILILLLTLLKSTFGFEAFSEKRMIDLLLLILVSEGSLG